MELVKILKYNESVPILDQKQISINRLKLSRLKLRIGRFKSSAPFNFSYRQNLLFRLPTISKYQKSRRDEPYKEDKRSVTTIGFV